MAITPLAPIGKDIIYICQTCGNREKEFALSDRNQKFCTRCGCVSVKSTLADSFNYVESTFVESSYYEQAP